MQSLKIILKLNNLEYFEILFSDPKPIFCCEEIELFFCNGKIKLQLSNDFAEETISSLKILLTKAINNNLWLDESIDKNLGYLWNDDLHKYSDPNFKPSKNHPDWAGLNYHMWSTNDIALDITDTWLYNDSDGNIILEITPRYKWLFGDLDSKPEDDPNFITYNEFMKNYQPYISRIIPLKVAQQWLQQANELLDLSEENKRIATLEAESE